MRRGDRITLPYAVCDRFSTFATIEISALLTAMGVVIALKLARLFSRHKPDLLVAGAG